MQNNVEDIFNEFIQYRLNTYAPDASLLHTSYQTFLSERQKKKKRRYFWFFFTLLVLVSSSGFYFLLSKKSQTGQSTNVKSNTFFQSDNLQRGKYNFGNGMVNSPEGNTIKSITPQGLIQVQKTGRKNKIKSLLKDSLLSDNESNTGPFYSGLTKNEFIQDSGSSYRKNLLNSQKIKMDSLRKTISTPLTVDTFYIVW